MNLEGTSTSEVFYFRAVTADGTVVNGSAEAASIREVTRDLKRQGLIPVEIGEQSQTGFHFRLPKLRLNRQGNLVQFLTGISTLLNAGMPVDRALALTAEGAQDRSFRSAVDNVLRLVKSGKSLSESLSAHPEYFSDMHINMVKAGELGGCLPSVFARLAEFEEGRGKLKNHIVSSLLYPALLMGVGIVSILVLLKFVVPRFTAVFESSHVAAPLPMLLLLECNKVLNAYGPWILGLLLVAIPLQAAFIGTPRGKLWWDTLLLRAPLFGEVIRKSETSRFARAMGILIGNGVPLVQSMTTARSMLGNQRIASSLFSVTQSVKRGEGVAAPMGRCEEFPKLAGQLLAMGEETGSLDSMFLRLAGIYENQTREAISRFTTLFEPLIILAAGLAVGAIIFSMLIAITSMNDVAGL